jgi:hypothetical protein
MSIPIELDDVDGYENLIVGVVAIMSNQPMHESAVLDRADAVVDKLHSFGKTFLTP